MRINNLRELLLKRTQDPSLQILIKMADDVVIEGIAVEALEKMARKGSSANHAIAAAGGHVLPLSTDAHPHENLDAALVHDNLSHHLTNYNAALKAGNRDVANQHLEQAMKTINYATKLEGATARKSHPEGMVRLRSGSTKPYSRDASGNLVAEHHEGRSLISPSAWEMNYSGSERKPNGVLKEVTKGWNRQTTKGRKAEDMFPNYQYLEMSPHPHAGGELYGHEKSAYPFHDLQVNGRYVDIDEKAPFAGEYKSHPFDSHPARGHAYTHSTDINPASASKFADEHKAWLSSPDFENWLKDQETKHENPEYANRGSKVSNPIHAKSTDNPHDLVAGRRALKGYSAPTSAPQTATPTAPASTSAPAESAAPPELHPDVVGIIKKLSANMPPDKIGSMLGMSPEQIKSALEKK